MTKAKYLYIYTKKEKEKRNIITTTAPSIVKCLSESSMLRLRSANQENQSLNCKARQPSTTPSFFFNAHFVPIAKLIYFPIDVMNALHWSSVCVCTVICEYFCMHGWIWNEMQLKTKWNGMYEAMDIRRIQQQGKRARERARENERSKKKK